ncbi:MAG: hypothetical protein GY847_20160 [Proteobacteria bacterium]|nr:hypothetical protein [Pseudomonadota bacterium]
MKAKKGWVPIFHDTETGRFHNQSWFAGRWHIGRDGWVQSTWPRSLMDACPDIQSPEHLKINESQISVIMSEVLAQDPTAPIKRFDGQKSMEPKNVD